MVHSLGDTVCSSENPLSSDEGAPAQVLVKGVDESHLPAPLGGCGVLPAHHPAGPVGALDAAHVLVAHGVVQGGTLVLGLVLAGAAPLGLGGRPHGEGVVEVVAAAVAGLPDAVLFPVASSLKLLALLYQLLPPDQQLLLADVRFGRTTDGRTFLARKQVGHGSVACNQFNNKICALKVYATFTDFEAL